MELSNRTALLFRGYARLERTRPGQSTWTAAGVTERVLATPLIDGFRWYPFWTTWAPDGSAVLELAWPVSGAAVPNVEGLIVVPLAGNSEPQLVAEYQPDASRLGLTGVPWVSPTTWAQVP